MLFFGLFLLLFLKSGECQQNTLYAETSNYLNEIIPIEIMALGRSVPLGAFYEAHENKFLESYNLFTANKDDNEFNKFITATETRETSITYSMEHNIKDKFHAIDVGAALKVDILGGAITLYDGYGNFFRDTKKSERSSRATLISSMLTQFEEVTVTDETLTEFIDFDILDKVEATHVVVGILWGGKNFITVEDVNNDEHDLTDVEGKLGGIVKHLGLEVAGKAKVHLNGDVLKQFTFQIFGDFVPDERPKNMLEAIEFMKNSPKELIKQNDGKGKPMKYVLLPINILKQLWQRSFDKNQVLIMLDDHVAEMFVALFDEINRVEQKLNDINHDATALNLYLPPKLISNFQQTLDGFIKFKIQTKETVSKKIIDARRGEPIAHLKQVITDAKTDEHSHINILNKYYNLFGPLLEEISFVKSLQRLNLTILYQGRFISDFLNTNHEMDTFVLLYNFDYPKELNTAINTFRMLLQTRKDGQVFAVLNAKILDNQIPYGLSNTPTVAQFKKGSVIDKNCKVDISGLTVANLWSVQDMKIIVDRLASENKVASGFMYVQYPYTQKPSDLWPNSKWEDYSKYYQDAMFKAFTTDSAPFPNDEHHVPFTKAKIPEIEVNVYPSKKYYGGTPIIEDVKRRESNKLFGDCKGSPCPLHEVPPHTPMAVGRLPIVDAQYDARTKLRIIISDADQAVPVNHAIKIWRVDV